MLRHFVLGEKVDICFFLNLSLWIKRWKDAFILCSEISEKILFEAHGDEKQQDEQLNFVRSIYSNVSLLSEQSDDDPTYAKRKMYLCESRILRKVVKELTDDVEFLKVYSEEAVTKHYQLNFPGEQVQSLHFYPNTHESVVAEINGNYIVKMPRPKRGLAGINAEQAVTDLIRDKVQLPIPAISVHADHGVMARYRKLPGVTLDKSRYSKLAEDDKQSLANQFAQFIVAMHSTPKDLIKEAKINLAPSWQLSLELIEKQLGTEQELVIKTLLPEVVRNHKQLQVPEANQVFGHFDLHGGNVLVNQQHNKVTGIIDFGNCKIGDLHQELSVMNLSSPDLAERIARCYEQLTQRKLNKLLIQHYTTVFYLNLLAGLKRKKADQKFNYWLGELNQWYEHLLKDRANKKLKSRKPASSIPAGWRQWLVSNLMKGSSPAGLQKVLREQGFSHVDIASEIMLAEEHPYTQAGKEIFHTLNKRNWLLQTCNSLAALDPRYSTRVEVRQTPDFETFVTDYYSKHLPVVLKGGVDHWPALKRWTPEYLSQNYGEKEIEVQFNRDNDPLYERNSGKHKKKILMKDFIDLVQNGGETNNYYMTANNAKNSLSSIEQLFEDVADFGEGYRQQETLQSGDFLWFGPKGTFTPNHHDITNNMLVQILGRKKVTLIPAFQVPWLYNDKGVYSAADFPEFNEQRHPHMKKITPMEVTIGPGDALFIPIGWWHCVESLDVSISISFTNFNVPNQFSVEFPR
jgi:aminoglycoside phosphotransferase